MYKQNKMKYQIKNNKGKLTECRLCSVKRLIKQKGKVVIYNYNTSKFEVKQVKINLLNIIKYYLND